MKERKTTDDEQPKTNEQNPLWNGAVGQGWVASQELVDQLFRPIED